MTKRIYSQSSRRTPKGIKRTKKRIETGEGEWKKYYTRKKSRYLKGEQAKQNIFDEKKENNCSILFQIANQRQQKHIREIVSKNVKYGNISEAITTRKCYEFAH